MLRNNLGEFRMLKSIGSGWIHCGEKCGVLNRDEDFLKVQCMKLKEGRSCSTILGIQNVV
jgi:hypothetical protein